jgi:hypothetical protein
MLSLRSQGPKTMTEAATTANRLNGLKGGRPPGKQSEMAALNRRFLKHCPEALETLLWNMKHSDNPAIQVACAREILDRGLGRPVRSIDRQAGQVLDMLTVITGVPRPELEPEPEMAEPQTIEGEIVNAAADHS